MLLKAIILALSMMAGGIGTLQAAVVLESYILLAVGLAMAAVGVLRATSSTGAAAA